MVDTLPFFLMSFDDPAEANQFEHIYLTHYEQMLRIALRILNNNMQYAEEAVSNAFESVIDHWDNFPADDPIYTKKYLYKIAKNEAIDIYRKHYGKRAALNLDELFDYPDTADMTQELIHRELYQSMLKILKSMSPQYRDVLSLYWLDQHTPQEISALLNRPVQTVYKQLERGRIMLQENLEKEMKV